MLIDPRVDGLRRPTEHVKVNGNRQSMTMCLVMDPSLEHPVNGKHQPDRKRQFSNASHSYFPTLPTIISILFLS